jgi:hypothetical protein
MVRITSIDDPLAGDPVAAADALWLMSYAALLGALGPDDAQLSVPTLRKVFAALRGEGVARQVFVASSATEDIAPGQWRSLLAAAREGVEVSPMPGAEWSAVVDVLDEELLADLLGVSASSLRRYRGGSRQTPQDVAARLHALALVVTDLAGSYNDFGIRRWFDRPRAQLDGRSPRVRLAGGFDPEGDDIAAVRSLSAALAGAGAT